LYFKGYGFPFHFLFRCLLNIQSGRQHHWPPVGGPSVNQSTQHNAAAVDQHSEAGVTRGQSAGGSPVRSQPEAPVGHSGSSQDILPVFSSDIIIQIMACVTQEVTSQLAQANTTTIVPDPAQPASLCAQPTALAPVQPPSLAPTQQLSSLSSVQPQLSEVPVCSLGNAAVSSSLNSVYSHLKVASFKKMAPVSMCWSPTEIPPHLLPENWQM